MIVMGLDLRSTGRGLNAVIHLAIDEGVVLFSGVTHWVFPYNLVCVTILEAGLEKRREQAIVNTSIDSSRAGIFHYHDSTHH